MRPEQVVQDFILLGFENFQGQRLHNLSGQAAPMFLCPHGEILFPYIQCELLFQFTPFVSLVLPPFAAVKSVACLLDDLLIGMRGLLLDPLKPSPLPFEQTLGPGTPGTYMGVYVGGKGECILMPSKPYEKQREKLLLWSHIVIQSN